MLLNPLNPKRLWFALVLFVFAVWQYLNSFANLKVVGCIMYLKPELLLISVSMLKFSKSKINIFHTSQIFWIAVFAFHSHTRVI